MVEWGSLSLSFWEACVTHNSVWVCVNQVAWRRGRQLIKRSNKQGNDSFCDTWGTKIISFLLSLNRSLSCRAVVDVGRRPYGGVGECRRKPSSASSSSTVQDPSDEQFTRRTRRFTAPMFGRFPPRSRRWTLSSFSLPTGCQRLLGLSRVSISSSSSSSSSPCSVYTAVFRVFFCVPFYNCVETL